MKLKGGTVKENDIRLCMELCERLRLEMERSSEIPVQCLSGKIRDALLEVREFQRRELDEIRKRIM